MGFTKHYHKLPDGRETGLAIFDEGADVMKHFHFVNGDKTSTADAASGHTHMLENQVTSKPVSEDKSAMSTQERETKRLGGFLVECKEESINGLNVGIVKGYITTWDVDRGNPYGIKDQFVKGAFQKSIAEHLERKRNIRFKDHHRRTVGMWNIDTVREDDKGLYGEAEINLDVQQGREAMALIRQGALSDFSIGFSVKEYTIDGDIRTITEAVIWEGSIVDEPMNPHAVVTDFKSVTPFQDLPLAERDREWDSTAAVKRVREFTDSTDAPTSAYRRAFLWYDRENAETFGAYKLPYADVVNGRLVAVPRAIFAAAAAMQGARGGVNIPEGDRPAVIRHIERYYAKMDMESPFKEADKQLFVIDDVKAMSKTDLEKALRRGASFTRSAAKFLVGSFAVDNKPEPGDNVTDSDQLNELVKAIQEIKSSFNK